MKGLGVKAGAANQARLRVSVPAGYTRVAGPHAPAERVE
jgi:hypothetical protein